MLPDNRDPGCPYCGGHVGAFIVGGNAYVLICNGCEAAVSIEDPDIISKSEALAAWAKNPERCGLRQTIAELAR